MPEIANTGYIKEEFSPTLQTLDSLTRVHALTYRLGVGQLLLDHLFAGDPANFSSKDTAKAVKFSAFVALCADELAQFNLSAHTLRESIRATVVYNSLPAATRDKLLFSHLIQLARCTDGHKRLPLFTPTTPFRRCSPPTRPSRPAGVIYAWCGELCPVHNARSKSPTSPSAGSATPIAAAEFLALDPRAPPSPMACRTKPRPQHRPQPRVRTSFMCATILPADGSRTPCRRRCTRTGWSGWPRSTRPRCRSTRP